ncbi:MAG: C25 family cysteine peptidase [Thermoplasmata archaeon]
MPSRDGLRIFGDRRFWALVAASIIVAAGAGVMLGGRPPVHIRAPSYVLPTDFIAVVEEPQTEWEMTFIACLAPIVTHNGYHPLFVLEGGKLDDHSLWTIQNSDLANLPVLLFSNSTEVEESLAAQLDRVERLPMSKHTLENFAGFSGHITVRSYREALWVAGLAAARNCTVGFGPTSYNTQERVWREMRKLGIPASYVVVANPADFETENFDMWHVRALSALAGEIAAYHRAYVVTDIVPSEEELVDMAGNDELRRLNANATGLLGLLRNISKDYGPIENVCIVGSHSSVPQFELPDLSNSEGDKQVSSDSCYGFLDDDDYTMDAAVGRIVNYNIQGAANQLVRTYCYDRILPTVNVNYSNGDSVIRNWRTHGASFNGYEITHKRMQATPGYYWCEDLADEGMTYEYYGPAGIGTAPLSSQTIKENDFDPMLMGSGLMAYRGHGSWHGSLYSLRIYFEFRQEGSVEADDARALFLPPQIAVFAACENAKIHGKSYSGTDIQFDRIFALSYLYGGAIVLVGATEVSYSDVGQDIPATVGRFTGDHDWDKNNAMYAFFWDGILNHEQDKDTVGKCFVWMINRYIKNHGGQLTPLKQQDATGGGADWKQVAMYVLYGDPAFGPFPTKPGPNEKDEWHNGPNDT